MIKLNTYLNVKETERMIIRPLSLNDIPSWEKFIMDKEATKFIPSGRKLDPIHARIWIERQLDRYKKDGYGLMALIEKSSNKFIGQCGLIVQEIDHVKELEIGYHLLPKYWNKGYASEAAHKVKVIGFENEETKSLISIIHPDNLASQKVALRNGMIKSARTNFKGQEVFIYGILREQYNKK